MSLSAAVVLDAPAARALTERIQAAVSDVWRLLEEAHDGRAWAALGYGTWAAYVQGEFAMSKQHSYRLLDQAHVIRELETAAGESPIGDLNEHQARVIKPHLADVCERVAADPELAEVFVAEELRAAKEDNERERQAHLDSLRRNGYHPKVDCPRCNGSGRIQEDEL